MRVWLERNEEEEEDWTGKQRVFETMEPPCCKVSSQMTGGRFLSLGTGQSRVTPFHWSSCMFNPLFFSIFISPPARIALISSSLSPHIIVPPHRPPSSHFHVIDPFPPNPLLCPSFLLPPSILPLLTSPIPSFPKTNTPWAGLSSLHLSLPLPVDAAFAQGLGSALCC
ncbi:unnamed protein product [Pleuronectes platessa]|uniref:Uncharacterized protein n=1 Tax=Pleuronectes platessa TaxID=8262 RepID=A0A9N7TQ69_PLEPL|nr:unnamed protein product [Pleuronectes platessa]